MEDRVIETETQRASREAECGCAQVLDVEQVRSRLERLRPMRDWFADENIEDGARQVAHTSHIPRDAYSDLSLRDAISLLRERDRQLEFAWSDLADLRAAQSLADPAGGHPYRSAPATAPPSRPVVASEATPTLSSAPDVGRRVYGALKCWLAPSVVGGACAVAVYGAAIHDKQVGLYALGAAFLSAACVASRDPEAWS